MMLLQIIQKPFNCIRGNKTFFITPQLSPMAAQGHTSTKYPYYIIPLQQKIHHIIDIFSNKSTKYRHPIGLWSGSEGNGYLLHCFLCSFLVVEPLFSKAVEAKSKLIEHLDNFQFSTKTSDYDQVEDSLWTKILIKLIINEALVWKQCWFYMIFY